MYNHSRVMSHPDIVIWQATHSLFLIACDTVNGFDSRHTLLVIKLVNVTPEK